ncbi:MAG: diaminopimelate dehydrogenase [Oscillospiraceae bacterium]|nr:diaminopimelate dehydrogenase [Oscillospiraceae bacterium]
MNKIRIGIAGYGNLGRGVEAAVRQNPDMELTAIFTRRGPEGIVPAAPGVPVYKTDAAASVAENVDILIICGGSATDLPVQGPQLAQYFSTIDSFDTHARIPEYFAAMDEAAVQSGHLSIISVGWDPGLFSLNRIYAEAVLPEGTTYTFWGKGVSQGHSDAIRRVSGVKKGIQYTIPVEKAVEQIRQGGQPQLSTREKHTRECFVVADETADKTAIEQAIVTMPNYFSDYDTTVHFISEEEFDRDHTKMPHGGFVIRSGNTACGDNQVIEYALKLESNPAFTASVLVAYARAAYRLVQRGKTGARTVMDIPPALLSPKTGEQLRAELL